MIDMPSVPPISTSDREVVDASPFAGLRSMGTAKTAWAWVLAVLLVLSFVVQWATIYFVLCGAQMDIWSLRGLSLAPTVMFVAAAKYLFK